MGNFYVSEVIARQVRELAPRVLGMVRQRLTDREIAATLNAEGVRTWEGKPFDVRAAYQLRHRVSKICVAVKKRSPNGVKSEGASIKRKPLHTASETVTVRPEAGKGREVLKHRKQRYP